MKKLRIVLTNSIHAEGMKILEPLGEVILPPDDSDATLLEVVRDADALIVRKKLPETIVNDASKLQVIVRHGVGVDYIPVKAATERGVIVANVPTANTQSVVEHVIGVLILLARKFHRLDQSWRRTPWNIRDQIQCCELYGKTVGIVGFGRIGSKVGRICREAFSMQLRVFDPYYTGGDVEQSDLYTLFSESDFITLHSPLTTDTLGLVNAELLSRMKPSAYLINAARGGLVDEQALSSILADGKIAGAALDVFQDEPISNDSPLLELDNVVLTPHTAALTTDSIIAMSTESAREVERVLSGSMPKNIVNPDVIPLFDERFR